MRTIFLLPLLVLFVYSASAQPKQALKKITELKMPRTQDDDMPGTRGASVAWHPVLKKYYAVFAGNSGYPLAVFDDKFKRLSTDMLDAMIDTRGLWYDPAKKQICGNAYSEFGWFSYTLDKAGIPTDYVTLLEGQNQPGAQSVGALNTLDKQVIFLQAGQLYKYDLQGTLLDSIPIHWSRTKADGPADDEDPELQNEDYNYTTAVYTGVKGQEVGLLNITNKQVELYDIKTGYLVKILTLPETTVTEASFNFAYANGIYWLFNIEDRKWVGYK